MVVHFVVDYSRNPILEPLNIGFRVRLDTTYFTENWKYCSKIISKCVNSAVGPVNSAWIVLWDP